MRACLALVILLIVPLGLSGCLGDGKMAGPDVGEPNPAVGYGLGGPPDGGTCPDVYYLSSKILPNGVTVTWTSSFGGFDYEIGSEYSATVEWALDSGSATFVYFGPRKKGKTFTPRGNDPTEGDLSHGDPGDGYLDVTVIMNEMHWSVEPSFMGNIGNGHFWLILDVENEEGEVVRAKLGVNFHLEDPAEGYSDRCPS